ncbi:PilZ domain-containing protein [Sphingomonas parva]|nr:PilZ domain-containing protein [Sphingomonas parva]
MLKLFSKTVGGRRKRAPRDAIKCSATIRLQNAFLKAELHDVSASGCKVALEVPLEPGQFIQIALESYHSLGAQIRWYREGFAGIQFIRPLSDAALANWKRAVVNGSNKDVVVGASGASTRRDFWGEVRHLEDD